jgi:methanogenic corrinoid protein MtbC1
MSSETIEKLKKSIKDYDRNAAKILAQKAVEENANPLEVVDELVAVISHIGKQFANEELFLPDLVGAADAMQAAMPVLEKRIKEMGMKRNKLGLVVIGTVFGDIHNIGKDMVSTLLLAEGFEIRDMGINVQAEQFVNAVKEHSPDILAMSSLLTTTAAEQQKVIEALKKEGLRDRVKIIVGGGAINSEFAENIGADGFEPTAVDAVSLAKKLVNAD